MNTTAEAMQSFSILVLFPILATAVFLDIRKHRIPNLLIVIAIGLALVLQTAVAGPDGALTAIAGMAIAVLFFLPFYIAGGMGAGDVKLMIGVGAYLGPATTVVACALTLMAGAVLGIIVILWRGAFSTVMHRFGAIFRSFMRTGHALYMPPTDRDVVAMKPFPYAAAIATGTFAAVTWWTEVL